MGRLSAMYGTNPCFPDKGPTMMCLAEDKKEKKKKFAWLGGSDRGRGSVVRGSGFKSEVPGFDPLAGQGEKKSVSVTLSQLSCRLVRA